MSKLLCVEGWLPCFAPEVTEIWGSRLPVIPTARGLPGLLSSSALHTYLWPVSARQLQGPGGPVEK